MLPPRSARRLWWSAAAFSKPGHGSFLGKMWEVAPPWVRNSINSETGPEIAYKVHLGAGPAGLRLSWDNR